MASQYTECDTQPGTSYGGNVPNVVMPQDVQISSSFGYEEKIPLAPPPPYPGDPAPTQAANQIIPEPLAYLDIMPKMLAPGAVGRKIEPIFSSFSTVIISANQWLAANPQYMVWKCESVEKKVERGPFVDLDSMLHHDSTFGFSVYVKGLRLWITPRGAIEAVQQLGLFTHLPRKDDMAEVITPLGFPGYIGGMARMQMKVQQPQNLRESLVNLNEKLNGNPIPGRIINVETSWDKAREGFQLDMYNPDCTCRHEKGGSARSYIQVIRIFYILGEPEFESIEIHDAVPKCTSKPDFNKPPKFQSFSDTVYQTGMWALEQQDMRIVNIQTFECPMFVFNNDVEILQNMTEALELFSKTNHFVKLVRVIYVQSKATSGLSYRQLCLTSRLFIPVRLGHIKYETMPQTVWRITSWLRATGLKIFGVDTQRMLLTNTTRGCGFEEERVDTTVYGNRAKFWVTAIRVYFGEIFQEPPSHLLPPEPNWEEKCDISCYCSLI